MEMMSGVIDGMGGTLFIHDFFF